MQHGLERGHRVVRHRADDLLVEVVAPGREVPPAVVIHLAEHPSGLLVKDQLMRGTSIGVESDAKAGLPIVGRRRAERLHAWDQRRRLVERGSDNRRYVALAQEVGDIRERVGWCVGPAVVLMNLREQSLRICGQ